MCLWDIIKEGKCLFLFFGFWLCSTAYGILVPQLGIEPMPPAMGVPSPDHCPNHWTTKEFPIFLLFIRIKVRRSS